MISMTYHYPFRDRPKPAPIRLSIRIERVPKRAWSRCCNEWPSSGSARRRSTSCATTRGRLRCRRPGSPARNL